MGPIWTFSGASLFVDGLLVGWERVVEGLRYHREALSENQSYSVRHGGFLFPHALLGSARGRKSLPICLFLSVRSFPLVSFVFGFSCSASA